MTSATSPSDDDRPSDYPSSRQHDRDRRRGRRVSARRGSPRVPWLYRFVRDHSGQSSTIGVALMLAVAAIGVTAVVTLGSSALTNTQSSADLQRTEHTMTLLDSRGAMAALGESNNQGVVLSGSPDGTYEVVDDTGWIRINHVNWTGDASEPPVELYNQTLGEVRYTNGDTVIAYQGGGVWRTDGNGTVMVSPPEFHYRDQTLTMPLVKVVGSGGASGRVTADVTPLNTGTDVTRIYPNTSASYPSPLSTDYDNPVENGTVVVTVKSDHYQGWADFFDERTEGELDVNHAKGTASIKLETLGGAPGNFAMPLVGDSLNVPSVATKHNVSDFELELAPDTSNANAFQQLQWSLYHQGPNGQQFELHFEGNGRCQSGEYNDDIGISVYYRHNSSAPSEEWQTTVDEDELDDSYSPSNPVVVDCNTADHSGSPVLKANLTSGLDMTYEDIDIQGSDNKWHFGNVIKAQDSPGTLTMGQHDPDPADVSTGQTQQLDFLVNHYFSRMGPDFELTVDAGPGNSQNRVDESVSGGTLNYDTIDGDEFIQFLHVTENEVRIELE